ncbi:MAG TPA: hypothetical protein H9731_07155 [Candidatus Borkfalkia excrementipullorum]|nr:hypothetical protein [Candidatus Borkfalkia excrementipullorum]
MYVVFRRGMSCSPAAAERYLRAAYLLVAYISYLRIRAQKCYSRRKKIARGALCNEKPRECIQ